MTSTLAAAEMAQVPAPKTPKTLSSYDDRVPREKTYAAELLLDEEPELDDFDLESEDEVEVDGVVGFESEDVDGFAVAGELLDEEPRLSLR
jgi:hypothetical protein